VVEAIRIAKRVGAERGADEPVTMLGYLVHNEHVTRELNEHGVGLVENADRMEGLAEITSGTVIFTAHGISPAVVQAAEERGLNVVDATCSDVTRTHSLVRTLVDQGSHVIYIGKRGHPEPTGVLGVAPNHTTLVETTEDVDRLDFPAGTRLAVTCQTTLSMWDTRVIIDKLVARYPDIEVHNEICRATQERQEAAVLAAEDLDCVIVVGSRRSSNSLRLVQVVIEHKNTPAHLVDNASELRPEWFTDVRRVGVTSGASTPTQLTREVIRTLEQWDAPAGGVLKATPPASRGRTPHAGSAGRSREGSRRSVESG
jgi:4-hydroxy-3-methylbut-2-enyl diphosphate reductase